MLLWKRFKAYFKLRWGLRFGLSLGTTAILLSGIIGLSITHSWAESSPQANLILSPAETMTYEVIDSGSAKQLRSKSLLLAKGSRGAAVQNLNYQLQQLGYGSSANSEKFDDATEQEVRAFQQQVGIVVDGIVGTETRQSLMSALAHGEVPRMLEKLQQKESGRSLLPPDMQQILGHGKLKVALLEQDNPPFFMENSAGELWGADVKVALDLAQELGVELEFNRSAKTFNEVVDLVYNHEVDLAISKISRTLKRAQRVRFSQPYLNMRQGLLVNRIQLAEKSKGDSTAETLRRLEGKIGVIKGSSYAGFVKQNFPQATVVELDTWTDVVEAVKKGNILAAYRDELEVKKIVLHEPNASLQFQTVALTDTADLIAMVIPWDSSQLQAFVNQYLDTAKLDYTADRLLEIYSDAL